MPYDGSADSSPTLGHWPAVRDRTRSLRHRHPGRCTAVPGRTNGSGICFASDLTHSGVNCPHPIFHHAEESADGHLFITVLAQVRAQILHWRQKNETVS